MEIRGEKFKIFIFLFVQPRVSKKEFENICSVRQIDGTAGGRGPLAVPSYCLTVNIFEASLEDLVAFDWEIPSFSSLAINTKIKVFPFKRNQILKDGFEHICSVRKYLLRVVIILGWFCPFSLFF